jgi:hypothetical protein
VSRAGALRLPLFLLVRSVMQQRRRRKLSATRSGGHQEPVELRSTAQTLRLRSGQASAPGPARSGVQAEFVNGELVRDQAKRRWASFAVASGREL